MKINADGFFESAKGVTGVHAAKVRGRWQYRAGKGGDLLASGMEPVAFMKSFWFREDFEGIEGAG